METYAYSNLHFHEVSTIQILEPSASLPPVDFNRVSHNKNTGCGASLVTFSKLLGNEEDYRAHDFKLRCVYFSPSLESIIIPSCKSQSVHGDSRASLIWSTSLNPDHTLSFKLTTMFCI
jgi:hypothetical protein